MLRERFLAFCRQQMRSFLISILAGAAFSTIFSIGKSHGREFLWGAAVGAVIGVAIWIWIATLQALFQPSIDRLAERYRPYAHGLTFLIAAFMGWFTGVFAARLIFGRIINLRGMTTGGALPFMIITGVLVVVVGLVFRSIEIMRERLAESMERLKQHEWAEKELELARAIQTRLLPPQKIDGTGFSIAARNFPAHLVAGDFYDVVELEDGSVAVIVADVAGKGMGASLIMASVKAVLPFIARSSVEDAMTALNNKLVQELDRREFVALAYARFYPSDGTLQLANAGFPDPYLIRGASIEPLVVGGIRLPLGIRKATIYQTMTTKLERSDRVVFVSDGIPEAPVEGDQPLGYDRLAEALRIGADDRADEWLEELLARIRKGVREPLEDDWTALVLQCTTGVRAVA
jgi:serine phosphatase RsbU (regulator of sigma subunit)